MKICPNCGKQNADINRFCENCGYTFEAGNSYAGSSQPYYTQGELNQKTNGLAIASLVLGIVGIVLVCCYSIGTLPGILAIIFGAISRKEILSSNGRQRGIGYSTAGLVLGIITVALAIVMVVIIAFSSASFMSFYDDF